MLVSAVLEQNCRLKSPWQQSASSASLGKPTIRIRRLGLIASRPKRSSNNDAPTETVMVRLSGITTGPRIPESSGGSFGSTCGTAPPVIRNSMRLFRVRNRRSRSSRSWASTSNETTMPEVGRGVTMPVWWMPWNSLWSWVFSLCGASVTWAAGAAARALPLRLLPASAAPATPNPSRTRRRSADTGALVGSKSFIENLFALLQARKAKGWVDSVECIRQCLGFVCDLLALISGDLVIRAITVVGFQAVELSVQCCRSPIDFLQQVASALGQQRTQQVDDLAGAFQVGGETVQVDVAVAFFFAVIADVGDAADVAGDDACQLFRCQVLRQQLLLEAGDVGL